MKKLDAEKIRKTKNRKFNRLESLPLKTDSDNKLNTNTSN